MKFTSYIAAAIMAYTASASAVPIPEESANPTTVTPPATAPTAPAFKYAPGPPPGLFVEFDPMDYKRDAAPEPWWYHRNNGWNNLPGMTWKRSAEPEPWWYHRNNGWNNLPGQTW